MKAYKYMDTIPKTKRIICFGAVVYVFSIILFTIVLKRYDEFNSLTDFAKLSYIIIPIILIIIVILLYVKQIFGAITSIAFIVLYNIASLLFENVRDLEIQMNPLFVFGALILFLHFFEKAIQSERVDYQILLNQYEQLNLNSQITKSMIEITPKMLINDSLDELLQMILEKAIQLIPNAQAGSILIKNANRMEFRAAVGYNLDLLKEINLQFEDMYQYRLGVLDEPAVIKDMKTFNEANLKKETTNDMRDKDALIAKSVLTCSFILNNTIYGFINLDNLEDYDAFNDQDKVHIKHFASQIEIALNNHLLIEEVYNLSRYDSLTGVNSRKYHEALIHDLFKDFKDNNKELSIIVMDVNFLKQINDTYGHHIGDQYLIHYTKIVKENIEISDIFSRTGGDEFVLVIPNANRDQAIKKVEKIRESVQNKPLICNGIEHFVEFGCGIANYPKDSDEWTELMRIADQRMYEDKKKSKNSRS